MNSMQKTSVLLCLTILVVTGAIGLAVNWPKIEARLQQPVMVQGTSQSQSNEVDPFRLDPPLPSLVKDLHPTYLIQAELETNQAKIVGSETIQFDNPNTPEVHLYLYDYTWSPMRILSIRHENEKLSFQRSGRVVRLANRFGNAERIALTVEFETMVPRSATRFGTKDDVWTLTNWYPMLGALSPDDQWYEPPRSVGYGDPFVYHYADYDVRFRSPEGYQWLSSWGRGERTRLAGGEQEIRYQGRKLLNFALVGSPLYHVEQMTIGDLTIDLAVRDKNRMPQVKTITEAAVQAYSEMFGTLPYPYVGIVETGHTYAMEYANLAIFSSAMYENNEINHWLPHEIAHLWWYNSVATLEAESGWIDEGLVEWSVYHYMQKRHGQAMADTVLKEYERELASLKQRYPDGSLSKSLGQFADYYEFDWTWYSKAAMLYEHLRKSIGDSRFASFLKRVQNQYHGAVIGAAHLDQALGQALNGQAAYFVPNMDKRNREPFADPVVQYYVGTILNGVPFYPAVPAREVGETVYLPLRDLMERFGFAVTWKEEGTIQLETAQKVISMQEKGTEVTLNGTSYRLPQPLLEIEDRTMVPLSFFQDVLKYQVEYDDTAKTVRITVPSK